jgi:hypothetical protein
MCAPDLPLNQDIWVNSILPFVGMGHFAFVGGVNRQMKQYYGAYCGSVEDPPKVLVKCTPELVEDDEDDEDDVYYDDRPAASNDTFYSAVFSSVACAEFWDRQGSKSVTQVFEINMCALIARTGNLQVLKWARKKKVPWGKETCREAASYGHLDILKYAHEHGCPWDESTCCGAAEYGRLEVLKYAHQHGCAWDTETCRNAAGMGHLDILKYVHDKGCPWGPRITYYAAVNGHLEVLKYALAKGYRHFDKYTWLLGKKFPHVLEWMKEQDWAAGFVTL